MVSYMNNIKTVDVKTTKKYKNTIKEIVLGKISKITVLGTVYYKMDLTEKGFNIAKEYKYNKLTYVRKTLLPYKSMLNLKNNDYKTICNELK